ncbi:aryl-alcohol dehydrogenase-like predicted oxidoreductase [Kribbella orskensis]|uniref:Aryl-alcohol dehydrogenase-like predicted oxidoreductase n=1 Tax=Kribbella orskensis TaxID=2512216 RepID=A0ABY2BTE7_9ACTN|nr:MULTISPECIES: aldo/keto reductase [Kribbella]TCN44682.1 aryl-alcohol dehydrogenase-like predicted oxidoreductase [Kribbella sp. VKM Ac-2500]TCO31540.1 aryl-alcohol dehydrogenase-like predicted oxidoreductase [Kribbella orskensis]
MDYHFLGRSGLQVSELCLGTMMFGEQTDEQTSHQILDTFVESGGNFIDTADVYGRGRSEEILGTWLKSRRREDYVVATKAFGEMGPGPNEQGLSRKHILDAVRASLRRLGTDHIDLYQLHVWDDGTPIEETLSTLDALVKEGTVRYIGASNFSGWQLQKAIDVSRQNGWESFVSLQPLYNLLDRDAEWELLPVSRSEGLGVLPWSPLRAGWLAGAHRRGMTSPSEGTRVERESEAGSIPWSGYATERTWRVIDEVSAIAAETGRTAAQVSLRWLMQREPATTPIIGARTVEQAKDNLAASGWSLTTEQTDRLTTASAPDTVPYPYDVLHRLSRR